MPRTNSRKNEKRSEPRALVTADIKGVLSVISKFKLVDISNTGALIKLPQRLSISSVYKVKFVQEDKKNAITLRCKVIRSKFTKTVFGNKGEPVPLYLVGLKFIELSSDLIKRLKLFIVSEEIRHKKGKSQDGE